MQGPDLLYYLGKEWEARQGSLSEEATFQRVERGVTKELCDTILNSDTCWEAGGQSKWLQDTG